MSSICRRKWQRRGFASGPLGNKGPCSGGCDEFTLTVEALAFVNPGLNNRDLGFIVSAANQEYFFQEEEGVVSRIIPWIALPEESMGREGGFFPSLNIKTDRSQR